MKVKILNEKKKTKTTKPGRKRISKKIAYLIDKEKMKVRANNKTKKFSFFFKINIVAIKAILIPYGILWIKHKLQGLWPRICSIKNAEINAIREKIRIIFR